LSYILPYLHTIHNKNKIIKCLNLFKEDKNIDTMSKVDIILSLSKLYSKQRMIYKDFKITISHSYSYVVSINSKEIIQSLIFANKKNNIFLNSLISILKNKKVNKFKQGEIAKILTSLCKRKHINILLNLIEDETINIYIKVEIFEALIYLNVINTKIINKIILKITDGNFSTDEQILIIRPLAYLAENKKFINNLIAIINNDNINHYIKQGIAIKFANDIDIIKKIKMNILFPYILIENTSKDKLFQLFDDRIINFNIIFKSMSYSTLPLYLKNNKLHTIENGEKISTKKVDEETLNKIKMLLKGEDLND